MAPSSTAPRYNLRARTSSTASPVVPTKGDMKAAAALLSMRSWAPIAVPSWSDFKGAAAAALSTRRALPRRACRDVASVTVVSQKAWPTATIADRVKARHASQF